MPFGWLSDEEEKVAKTAGKKKMKRSVKAESNERMIDVGGLI